MHNTLDLLVDAALLEERRSTWVYKGTQGCWPWVVGGGGVFDSIDDLLFFFVFFRVAVLVVFFFHVILGKEKVLKGVFKKYVNSVSSAHTGAVTY